ncbi:MAG: 16S rRNA (guanine(527)-N(7))-methyltransferase RsmG [Aquincola sp.]|nr:16S rRNA (guanine(527)-N(7))-methyltransferase RsmG [Aquincola sp.]
MAALQAYEALVARWNPAINLVGKATLPLFWQRHITDSAQLMRFCPAEAESWVDLGSGGGLPGLVIAVLAMELRPQLRVTLVEADARKATFLRQAGLALGLEVEVLCERIEALSPRRADVLSARALASLRALIGYAGAHLAENGIAIFPKGARHAEEIADAKAEWAFDVDTQPSMSDSEASILLIRNIQRAHA